MKIRFSKHEREVRVEPVDTSDSVPWAAYRKAIRPARYIRSQRVDLVMPDVLDDVVRQARDAGFEVEIDPSLASWQRQKRTAEDWLDRQAVLKRIRDLEDLFYKREGQKFTPYQHEGIRWLANRTAALLADEMGLGKTMQAIVAAAQEVPVLIITPASLKGNWLGEIEKFRPNVRPKILQGKKSFRFPRAGEWLIANYEMLPKAHDEEGVNGRKCEGFLPPVKCTGCKDVLVDLPHGGIATRTEGHEAKCDAKGNLKDPFPCPGCAPIYDLILPGTIVIPDEAQKAKSNTSAMGINARALTRAVRDRQGRSWALTGTPFENKAAELWATLQLAGVEKICFGAKSVFAGLFNAKVGRFGGYQWGDPDGSEVSERLQRGSLRRLKGNELSLPPKVYSDHVVDLDTRSIAQVDKYMSALGGLYAVEQRMEAVIAKAKTDELPNFMEMTAMLQALALAKLPALLELVDEFEKADVPVIVFSMFAPPILLLEKRRGWTAIHGGVKNEDRQPRVKGFQDGKYKGIAGTVMAMGTGFTLTRASVVLFLDEPWNPAKADQAADRAHRMGQNKTVQVVRVRADHPLDRRIAEVLMTKRRMFAATVDASAVIAAAAAKEENPLQADAKRYDAEVMAGAAKLREASGEDEEAVLDQLHDLFFPEQDRGLVSDLAEQASHVGLSDNQWKLAAAVAKLGRSLEQNIKDREAGQPEDLLPGNSPETKKSENIVAGGEKEVLGIDSSPSTPSEPPAKEVGAAANDSVRWEAAKMGDESKANASGAAANESKVDRALKVLQTMEDDERGALFESLDAIIDSEMPKPERLRLFAFLHAVEEMTGKEMDELGDKVKDEFCGCGVPVDEDHECDLDDEDEDEEDDEDETPCRKRARA